MYYDQCYLDALDGGKQLDEPRIYTVAKGKPTFAHSSILGGTDTERSS